MKNYGFLIPCDYFNHTRPDADFTDIFNALASAGFGITLLDSETLKPTTPLCADRFWYRGWMLNTSQYQQLAANVPLVVSVNEYLHSHLISGWYESIKKYTFETIFTDDPERDFENSGWDAAIIKDYVKSLNTGQGSIVRSRTDIPKIVSELNKYRGSIEGGIVLRRFEELNQKETRFFVLDGVVHSSAKNDAFTYVENISKLHKARFFSVDIAMTVTGEYRVVEIGDGQVSDVKEWDSKQWVDMFETAGASATFCI